MTPYKIHTNYIKHTKMVKYIMIMTLLFAM